MKVAIIGCGLIGRKRALALGANDILVSCCDTNSHLAEKFGNEFSCEPFTNYQQLFEDIDCDAVVISVVNKYAKEIAVYALKRGIHVLAEKPLGRNASEAKEILDASLRDDNSIILKTGFNHRFHPAIWQAKQLMDKGSIGKVFNIRARYGHGGRPGMEKEWRASKDLCGGGELLDQGVHIIDLIRWFGGEVKEVFGNVETKFWALEVEDNAMAVIKTDKNVSASMHVSWTNWKNIFSFEVFGTDGYLRIEGLGGSYGSETLEFGKRRREGGRPDIEIFEYSSEDISWVEEWKEFQNAIMNKREVIGNGFDGYKANEVIEALYNSNLKRKAILL